MSQLRPNVSPARIDSSQIMTKTTISCCLLVIRGIVRRHADTDLTGRQLLPNDNAERLAVGLFVAGAVIVVVLVAVVAVQ